MRESAGKMPGKQTGKTGNTGKSRNPEPGKTGKHPLGGFPFPGGSGALSRQSRNDRLRIIQTYEAADRASGQERRRLLRQAAAMTQTHLQVVALEEALA